MRRSARLVFASSLLTLACQHPTPPRATDAGARPPSTRDAQASVDAGDPRAPASRLAAFGNAGALRDWWRARRQGPTRRGGADAAANEGMMGGTLGDATGFGGLGATGTGVGGGGTGDGTIGMGSIGTLGHGAGTGTGQGYGAGAGRRSSAARPSGAPSAPGTRVGAPSETITNNQVEGVDEGDIVKMHGDHMVVLRRGRLFSLRLGGDALTPVSMVEAYGRGRTPGGWYDEMLVDGDTVVVIGYSYSARASEVGLFDIDAEGRITWRDTMFVRSSDYYSARNYASRLVGHHLVMYIPVPLREESAERLSLPSIRHRPDADWESVVGYDRLYRPVQELGWNPTVHSVVSCDLANRGFACRAVGVVGPSGRNFYVSGSAVYLWVHAPRRGIWAGRNPPPAAEPPPPAVVYRFPLDCSGVGAMRARGGPVDQFSFDEREGTLRVLVRADAAGDAMWAAEVTQGDFGFARLPVARFTDEVPTLERTAYRGLPRIEGARRSVQNRFVGDAVLYGAGRGWMGRRAPGAAPEPNAVTVYDAGRDTVTRLEVPHSVERIEPLGRDALVVGDEGDDLTFSAVALDATPALAGRHTVRGASQGESRSHGFFFRPSGDRAGTLGLPITYGADGGGFAQLRNVSSAVLFLGVDGLRFTDAGSLRSGRAAAVDDRCVASCSDWYGNARPVFWGDRTFALMGYELVEGATTAGRDRERRRVDFLRALQGTAGDNRRNAFDNITD